MLNISIAANVVSLATKKSNPAGTTFELKFVRFFINWVQFLWESNTA